VQCIAVEPHLTGCPIEVLPEGERQVEVDTEIDETVEGEAQLDAPGTQASPIGHHSAGRQVDSSGIEVATFPALASRLRS
jgi:hypothetical protein